MFKSLVHDDQSKLDLYMLLLFALAMGSSFLLCVYLGTSVESLNAHSYVWFLSFLFGFSYAVFQLMFWARLVIKEMVELFFFLSLLVLSLFAFLGITLSFGGVSGVFVPTSTVAFVVSFGLSICFVSFSVSLVYFGSRLLQSIKESVSIIS